MSGAIRGNQSGWKDDARIKPPQTWGLRHKECSKCGTIAPRKWDDPCPFCFHIETQPPRRQARKHANAV